MKYICRYPLVHTEVGELSQNRVMGSYCLGHPEYIISFVRQVVGHELGQPSYNIGWFTAESHEYGLIKLECTDTLKLKFILIGLITHQKQCHSIFKKNIECKCFVQMLLLRGHCYCFYNLMSQGLSIHLLDQTLCVPCLLKVTSVIVKAWVWFPFQQLPSCIGLFLMISLHQFSEDMLPLYKVPLIFKPCFIVYKSHYIALTFFIILMPSH